MTNEEKIQQSIDILDERGKELLKEAIEVDGYKNEVCSKCGGVFLAHHHYIRCFDDPCPMKSKSDTRSLLEMMFGVDKNES